MGNNTECECLNEKEAANHFADKFLTLRKNLVEGRRTIWEIASEIRQESNKIIRTIIPELQHLSDAQISQMLDDYHRQIETNPA